MHPGSTKHLIGIKVITSHSMGKQPMINKQKQEERTAQGNGTEKLSYNLRQHNLKPSHLVLETVCESTLMNGVPNLGPPGVLGLQCPEILASRGGSEGFWEF